MASIILISVYVFAAVFIGLSGILYLSFPLPQFFEDLLLYGKARGKRKEWSFVRILEIPKKWFIHFYIVGAVVNAYFLYTVVFAYILGQQPPAWFIYALDLFTSSTEVKTGAMSAIFLIAMMFLQNVRRLYECLFVSVYSSGTMNMAHYLLAWILYSTWGFAVLSEAPNIISYRIHDVHKEMHTPFHLLGVILFVFSSYNHNKVHHIFGNLRKNKEGSVTTYKHKVPTGSWFKWVSCPHYLFEILIYLSFAIVAGLSHVTVWTVVLFVVTNQLVAGTITHKWYKNEYKNYPKNRKAIIPFIF